MENMRDAFGCEVGLSDHSGTIFASLAAVALGARVLEVHVTLSREAFGPDVASSVTTSELAQLTEGARFVATALAHPVDKDAAADVDADKISWMWDVTTVQDKKITEDNAEGIASRVYRPGPYTPLESQTAFFIETYLSQMKSLVTGERSEAKTDWEAPMQLFASPKAACAAPRH